MAINPASLQAPDKLPGGEVPDFCGLIPISRGQPVSAWRKRDVTARLGKNVLQFTGGIIPKFSAAAILDI